MGGEQRAEEEAAATADAMFVCPVLELPPAELLRRA